MLNLHDHEMCSGHYFKNSDNSWDLKISLSKQMNLSANLNMQTASFICFLT